MRMLILRTLLWLLLGCTVILGAFLALAGVSLLIGSFYAGGELNPTQLSVWTAILRGVALQGLVPLLLLTGASWVLLVRKRPSLDRRWISLALGLAALATLWFPLVGRFFFIMWSPGSWVDYANTLWLMVGGVTVALLLARRLAARRIGPGNFFQEPTPVS